jgi:cardiolipin synthase (CMP-forming)
MIKTNMLTITLPTYFTLIRLLLIPGILAGMIMKAWLLATVLFVIASITDILDGYLARSLNQVSPLGTILDPLADKLMLIVVYGGLMMSSFIPFSIPLWFVLFVVFHELLMIGGSIYLALLKQKIEIAPTRLGKLIGVGQFLFIMWVLLCGFLQVQPQALFWGILMLVFISRLCVLIQYGTLAFKRI